MLIGFLRLLMTSPSISSFSWVSFLPSYCPCLRCSLAFSLAFACLRARSHRCGLSFGTFLLVLCPCAFRSPSNIQHRDGRSLWPNPREAEYRVSSVFGKE